MSISDHDLLFKLHLLLCFSVTVSAARSVPSLRSSSNSIVSVSESAEALLRWKDSLSYYSPNPLDSWLPATSFDGISPCQWKGIECDDSSGYVLEIQLKGLELVGTLDNLNFSSFQALKNLDLSMNSLHGNIPPGISSMTNISKLDLSSNSLTGELSPTLFSSNWSQISLLDLSFNQLGGEIPSEISLLSKLKHLDLSANQLTGLLPASIGTNLCNLTFLSLSGNQISGSIPTELGILINLQFLDLHYNNLSGELSSSIFIANWTQLATLNLAYNQLVGEIPPSLSMLSSLQHLDLSGNQLNGIIPPTIGNLEALLSLILSSNHLTGEIPPTLGNLRSLKNIDLGSNQITGSIPSEVSQLEMLMNVDMSGNSLTGQIPILNNFAFLESLLLGDNQLSGYIPSEMDNLMNLIHLNLSSNKLFGSIPPPLLYMPELVTLSLSANRLSGEIPSDLGLERLQTLDLSRNNLSGPIPVTIFQNLPSLTNLNLSHNLLSSLDPSVTVSELRSLRTFDLSYNYLKLPLLYKNVLPVANLDHNAGFFIPEKSPSTVPPHNSPVNGRNHSSRRRLIVMLLIVMNALLAVSASLLVCIKIRKSWKQKAVETVKEKANEMNIQNLFSEWNYDGRIVFEDIIEATENFDDIYCLGIGADGSVYEAELPTGQTVAVKKFHQSENGEILNESNFLNELRAVTEIRHRNIVKHYGFCLHTRSMFLVYEYMEKGSLSRILRNDERAVELNWERRINAVKGVADALCYIHHDCKPPIVHRDITSNNILFDSEYKACISDFGTSKLLKLDSSTWTNVAGTHGYIAPEFAYTMKVTEKCDVYSFGVVTLEMIMGRHPEELILSMMSSSSNQSTAFVKDVLHDQRLPHPTNQVANEVHVIVTTALACLCVDPKSRPTMECISKKLSTSRSHSIEPTGAN